MTTRIWRLGQAWFSILALITVSTLAARAAEFERPSTEQPMTEAMMAACTAEASPKIKEVLERGTLNWALGLAPPFGFRQQDGSYGGIEVDNARELAHMMGVEVDIQDYDYNLLPTAVTTGQADIIGAELFITEQRQKVIDYSDVYFVAGQLFFVLEDSKFHTVEDLDTPDNRFIHEIGGGQVEMAEKLIPNAPIRLVPKRGIFLVGYDFIKAGEADSTAFEGHYYPVFRREYPDLVAIGKEGRIEEAPADPEKMLYPFDIGFGLPKGDPGWKACINAYVADLLDSGRLQQRINYWAVHMGSATTE